MVGGSMPLLFLDEREASDDIFVEHAHLASSFFIASPDLDPQVFVDSPDLSPQIFVDSPDLGPQIFVESPDLGPQVFVDSPDLGPQALVDSSDLAPQALIASTNLVSHRRKLTANLVAELQELRFEAIHPFGQRFEAFHATLQPIYTTGKSLLRHRRHLDCGKPLTSTRSRDECLLPAVCHLEDRHIDRRRYHRRSAARNIMIHVRPAAGVSATFDRSRLRAGGASAFAEASADRGSLGGGWSASLAEARGEPRRAEAGARRAR
ncbi:MAG: hypothetical protein DMF92_00490 [Acidobacteria bacterium]|nr:MAG: hypothetical protein DMF92_00490 [Acidobacteriota bacterium]